MTGFAPRDPPLCMTTLKGGNIAVLSQIHFTASDYRLKENLDYIVNIFSHIITYCSAFYESTLMTGLNYFRTFSSMMLHFFGCGVMIFKSSFRLGCYTWVQRKRMRRDF